MRTPPVDKTAKWPENHRFVGPPSAEIDDNWAGLLEGRYFSVSEEEAVEAWGDRRHEYVDEERGGYTAGLDVFHTLHCLVSSTLLSLPNMEPPPLPPSLIPPGEIKRSDGPGPWREKGFFFFLFFFFYFLPQADFRTPSPPPTTEPTPHGSLP